MEKTTQLRKACDLCYIRKLKCDKKQPQCSNCIIYAATCTRSVGSRPSRRKTAGRNEQAKQDVLGSQDHQVSPTESKDDSMSLPPLQEAISMVGVFLNTVNSALPLFDSDTLLCIVGRCYALPPHQRSPAEWAAVNIVLALASQHMPADHVNDETVSTGDTSYRADEYTSKAQSAIPQLMLGESSLLDVQVLVGIVMVLQTAPDATAALILISGVMRLVHKLGLHDRAASAHLDLAERRQRARVFWIAYMLDKTLSLRARQPSLQLDDDIDLDHPSSLSFSLASDTQGSQAPGVIVASEGSFRMDYFAARVQLATIEGGIYDYLYSTRSSKRSAMERRMAVESLVVALENWRAAIPPEFCAGAVAAHMKCNSSHLSFLYVLHSASLLCITLIRQANAWDESWVNRLEQDRTGNLEQLPPGWEMLVSESRDLMSLFASVWRPDAWYRWMASCSYITAMVILVANDQRHPWHDQSQSDSRLIDAAMSWIEAKIADGDKTGTYEAIKAACVEAIRVARQQRRDGAAVGSGSIPPPDRLLHVQ